jgi:protein deglycase
MVYVLLAEGFEEIEALTVVDILRRASIKTKTVSVNNREMVTGAHIMEVKADCFIDKKKLKDADMIVLPGGMPGTTNLEKSKDVSEILEYRVQKGLWIAAICAAPSILGKKDYLKDREATCFPGFEKYLKGAIVKNDNVVVSGNFITSKGPGTASDFAYEIVSVLKDADTAQTLKSQMQYK